VTGFGVHRGTDPVRIGPAARLSLSMHHQRPTGNCAGADNPTNRLDKCIVAKQNPYRILLVDDEPGIRKILRLFLELEGYTVFEAITANQAMQVVKKERPHLIILDVILFGQTGFDVCEWVKNNPETKDIIIFLFTALNQEHDYREGQRLGCDLYLTKPQNPKDIVEKVREFLQARESALPQP
jgi:CheY-like chemotaxis protein